MRFFVLYFIKSYFWPKEYPFFCCFYGEVVVNCNPRLGLIVGSQAVGSQQVRVYKRPCSLARAYYCRLPDCRLLAGVRCPRPYPWSRPTVDPPSVASQQVCVCSRPNPRFCVCPYTVSSLLVRLSLTQFRGSGLV